MSVNINLPVLFSQLPHVGQVVGAEQANPEVQQTLMREMAQEARKLEREQIQKTGESEDSKSIKDREAGGQDAGGGPGRRRKRQAKQAEEEPKPEVKKSPWSGNIIDSRI